MFFARQLKCNFISFIFDNCSLRLSKNNISRCRQLLRATMSDNNDPEDMVISISDDENITGEATVTNNVQPVITLDDNNLRRSWSAENLTVYRQFNWWNGAPYFYYNWAPFNPTQQEKHYWNNGQIYPSVSEYPMTSPCYSHSYFPGTFVNRAPENYFFHGGGPPLYQAYNHLPYSQSVDSMQKRYYIRRHNSDDNIPKHNAVNPKVLKLLSKRYWEDVRKKKSKSSKPGVEFTVMSYNVLAQDLINGHLYLYRNHNPRSLQWEKRWKNLLEEISKLMPDIMALQEVQESHLTGFYSRLESMGYKGIYKKRTGIRCDGCAIYYKTDKFKLLECETVEFYQPNVDVLNRDNVGIIAKFSPNVSPESAFVVATTHLLYNPKRQDVRLAQTQLLLTEVERMSFSCKSRHGPCYWPIIITGDFNSTPDSPVYEFITKGVLKYDHLSARRLENIKSVTSSCHGNVLVPSVLEITGRVDVVWLRGARCHKMKHFLTDDKVSRYVLGNFNYTILDKCQHARLVQQRQKTENISRKDEITLIRLHHSDKSVNKVSSESTDNPGPFCSGTLSHLFALKSVYNHGEPDDVEGTTFQDKWLSVDYIFYSGKPRSEGFKERKLKLISRYRLPRKSELGSINIPNSVLGSDHLSLVAKFKLKI